MSDLTEPRDSRGRFIPYKTETILERKFDKFSEVLSSVDNYVSKIFAINESQLKSMEEENERRRSQEEFDKLKRNEETKVTGETTKKNKFGPAASKKDDVKDSDAFWGALFGGLSASLTKSTLVRGGLFLAAAPFINKFVTDYIAETSKIIGFGEDTAKTFGDSAGLAAATGLIGAAFGKRLGFIGAAGGAAYGLKDEVAAAMGLDEDQMIEAFGMQMKADNVIGGIMAAMTGASAYVLTKGSFWKGAANLAMKSPLMAVARGFVPTAIASGVFMLHKAYGDDVKDYLEGVGANKFTADIVVDGVSYATMGAAIGSLVPGIGTMIGALIGLGIGVLSSVTNWLRAKRDENLENTISKYSDALSNWDNLTDDDKNRLQAEMDRDLQLSFANDLSQNESFKGVQSKLGTQAVSEATMQSNGDWYSLQNVIKPMIRNKDGSFTEDYNNLMMEAADFKTTPERRIEILGEVIRKLKSSNSALANANNDELLTALLSVDNLPILPDVANTINNPEQKAQVFSFTPSSNSSSISDAKIERVEKEVAKRDAANVIVSAPVNNNNVSIINGGSNISSSTSNMFGGGGGNRRQDPYGMPR